MTLGSKGRRIGLSPRVRGNLPYSVITRGRLQSIPACAGEPIFDLFRPRSRAVYPRVCGGTLHCMNHAQQANGLSPRVRGNHSLRRYPAQCRGSIPACAGEPWYPKNAAVMSGVYPRVCGGTPQVDSMPILPFGSIPACAGEPPRLLDSPVFTRVYPRVCGGTRVRPSVDANPQGLSPRVRGNQARRRVSHVGRGSIPACAGEPRSWSYTRRKTRVYPRVCGGTRTGHLVYPEPEGLSPRVRGNRVLILWRHSALRSIPACAGEPPPCLRGWPEATVYPRVCGGTPCVLRATHRLNGLSPRVRGNPDRLDESDRRYGSIPACAGEPSRNASNDGVSKVYPRVCGGTYARHDLDSGWQGLSPRVRGNRMRVRFLPVTRRSIPACAGEPPRREAIGIQSRVYPRVCGGTAVHGVSFHALKGLSPRVRGNQVNVRRDRHCTRSIPACAGEPWNASFSLL